MNLMVQDIFSQQWEFMHAICIISIIKKTTISTDARRADGHTSDSIYVQLFRGTGPYELSKHKMIKDTFLTPENDLSNVT